MKGIALADRPRSGVENMAMDQRMLESAAELKRPLLRVYQWSQPTVSLGYFQKHSLYRQHPASEAPAVVRRATGGGAILHHYDWTYALALPVEVAGGGAIGAAMPVYDCAHDAVVAWLKQHGWDARKWSDSDLLPASNTPQAGKSAEFLCFARRTKGDVVVEGAKVLGSAQRRIRGALLQHGSLLLKRSPFTSELPGLYELSAALRPNPADTFLGQPGPQLLLEVLIEPLENLLGIKFERAVEMSGVLELEGHLDQKFGTPEWLQRV